MKNTSPTALLLNLGHAMDHWVLVIFLYTVSVLAGVWGTDWKELTPFAFGASFMFGAGSIVLTTGVTATGAGAARATGVTVALTHVAVRTSSNALAPKPSPGRRRLVGRTMAASRCSNCDRLAIAGAGRQKAHASSSRLRA